MVEHYKAFKMDHRYIYIRCNHCFRLRNKIVGTPTTPTGKKFNNMKCGFHIYNSNNDFSNRIIESMSHCLFTEDRWVTIEVNDKTLKIR
jgi:hypothetical protein